MDHLSNPSFVSGRLLERSDLSNGGLDDELIIDVAAGSAVSANRFERASVDVAPRGNRQRAAFEIIGGAAVAIAGLTFVGKAVRNAFRWRGRGQLYDLVLLWAPGVVAIILSLAAINLIGVNPSGSVAYGLGVILFGAELAILIIGGSDAAAFPAFLSDPV